MKTPLVIMRNSALSDNQRYSILSNELIRRLSNTNHVDQDMEDVHNIIETLIQELKNSGYNRKYSKEIVVSGILDGRERLAGGSRKENPSTEVHQVHWPRDAGRSSLRKPLGIRTKEKEKMMQMEGRTRSCVQKAEIEPDKLNHVAYCRGGADWTLPRQSL